MDRKRWANILCNEKMEPFKMIVTDGYFKSEIGIANSDLKTAKRAAREIYSVHPGNILVSQIFDNNTNDKGVC